MYVCQAAPCLSSTLFVDPLAYHPSQRPVASATLRSADGSSHCFHCLPRIPALLCDLAVIGDTGTLGHRVCEKIPIFVGVERRYISLGTICGIWIE